MSVGGTVVEVVDAGDRIWVNIRRMGYLGDTGRWVPSERRTCAIFVVRDSRALCIEPGDSLWWQGRHAIWRSKAGGPSDIKLERIGYSGVDRPVLAGQNAQEPK